MSHKANLAGVTPSGRTREQIALRGRKIIVGNLDCKSHGGEDGRFGEVLGMG